MFIGKDSAGYGGKRSGRLNSSSGRSGVIMKTRIKEALYGWGYVTKIETGLTVSMESRR